MAKKHESTITDLSKPYEQNVIGFGGIVKFAIGLLLLIVVTFALMVLLNSVLEDNKQAEFKAQENPMAVSDRERLPPEPRLQLAPGFGVDSTGGRVNMELAAPQSEYRELQRQWDDIREHGKKDPGTGATIWMPIDAAKEKVLEENLKAKSGPEAEKLFAESKKYVSDASSGRKSSVTRR
jgi:hypothetical protein